MSPRIIAHRGNSSVAPENTVAAWDSALAVSADAIETDLHLTADGVAVVIHDGELDRTTDGSGRIAETASVVVTAADAGSWFGPEFAGCRVPTLADVAAWGVAHPQIGWLHEVKPALTVEQVEPVVAVLRAAGMLERTVMQTFSLVTARSLQLAAPDVRTELLVGELPGRDELLALVRDLGVAGCNPDGRHLVDRPELVGVLHGEGLTVTPWTLDEPELWQAVVPLGVDGVITNRPRELRAWLAG